MSPNRVTEQYIAAERALSGHVLSLLDVMLPPRVLSGDPECRRRGRLVVAINLAMLSAAMLLWLVAGTNHDPWSDPHFGGVLVAVWAVVAIGIRAGMPLVLAANLLPAGVYLSCMGLTLVSGGEATAALLANPLVPLIAIVLVGRRAAAGWTAAVLAGLLVTVGLGAAGADFPLSEARLNWPYLRFPFVMTVSLFVASLGFVFEWLRGLALNEARASREALAVNEERYRALTENAGDVVSEIDDEMNFAYVSPNCLDLTGWLPTELVGSAFTSLLHPDEIPELRRQMSELQEDGGSSRILFRLRHKSGRWLHVDATSRLYRSGSGERRVLSISRDVSELRQAELAVRRSERLASTGTLAAGVAHQINNPVGAILQAAEYGLLSLEERDLDSVARSLLDSADQAKRCGAIVRGLLRFARHEPAAKQQEELSDVLRRACDLTSSYARQRGVEIEVSVADEPLPVEVNPVEMEQVILNLLRNAIEACSESASVDVALSRHGNLARLVIRDEGAGIRGEDLPHIFDPFFTTRLAEGGSGLGLSVVHGILDEHDGCIHVESDLGKGTEVRVELPLSPQTTLGRDLAAHVEDPGLSSRPAGSESSSPSHR